MKTFASIAVLCLLAAPFIAPARADDDTTPSFYDEIKAGDYKALAKKLRENIDLAKADPDLRFYLEKNIEYLEAGAPPPASGREVILIRGAKNDRLYKALPSSGGAEFMLPNTIRYQRTAWDPRLARIEKYFTEATTAKGGDGTKLEELSKIMEHHKGGGLNKSSNSVKSVLISASTKPLPTFGPPYYILRVPAERAIFNYNGLSGEREVLLPFWILPSEIVAKCDTLQEVLDNPIYQASQTKDLEPRKWADGTTTDNWKIIEANVRAGRPLLEGVVGLNSAFAEGRGVGPDATDVELERFEREVTKRGGTVERLAADDPRLPENSQGRTLLRDGHPHVFLPEGPVKKFALVDELEHVRQLKRALDEKGRPHVEKLFTDALLDVKDAVVTLLGWEIGAKKAVLRTIRREDPAHEVVARSLAALESARTARSSEEGLPPPSRARAVDRAGERGFERTVESSFDRGFDRARAPGSRGITSELLRERVDAPHERDRVR